MTSFRRSFVRRSFVRSCVRSLIDKLYKVLHRELLMGVPEIVFQPVKITSADCVPELVFQPVKITSAESAGQCQHFIAFSISIPESAQ